MTTSLRARRWRRLLTVFSLSGVALVAGAGVAAAHVTVNPSDAAAGSFTTLTFRVPNESPTAGTVGITVALPTDHPFASVAVKAVPGWTVKPSKTTLPAPVTQVDPETGGETTIKEAVTSVTWTADKGVSVGPGEFAEFELSVGPVPAVNELTFPTTQTYNDGEVVQWNEPTPASGEEPEHPLPTLTVTPAGTGEGDEHSHGGEASGSASAPGSASASASAAVSASASEAAVSPAAGTDTTAAPSSDSSNSATILAVVSLVIAAASLVVAAVALRRRPTGGAAR
jgi:uncharacterized protein YcnI